MNPNLKTLVDKQRSNFLKNGPTSVGDRIKALQKFKQCLKDNKNNLTDAMRKDLGRTPYESYLIELLGAIFETEHTLKMTRRWTKRKRAKTPWLLQPAKSWLEPQPYGQTLIIAPWNYPVLLLLAPMLGAVAAGNTVLLVAASETPNVAKVLAKVIKESFAPEHVAMLEPSPDSVTEAMSLKMDYVFFTGSPRVGKIIMKQAAQHLTPVTLELGGKSPCIVHKDADLEVASRRVVWGRFTNSGQTCVAPDYLLVHEDILEDFKQRLIDKINQFYPSSKNSSTSKFKIIHSKSYERLKSYLDKSEILYGGACDDASRSIAPTLVLSPKDSHPLSKEEIFGPILPIYSYSDTDDLVLKLTEQEKPLAMYCFTKDRELQNTLTLKTYSGGLLFNDTMMHVASAHLPFGGVGKSGMGSYHGKYSFETFTHYKPCMRRSFKFDLKFRYPPYPTSTKLFEFVTKFSKVLRGFF